MRQRESYASFPSTESLRHPQGPDLSAVNWTPLSASGTTNSLWRGVLGDSTYVLRVNADGSRSYGADRDREAAVLSTIQGFDWAPRVYLNAPDRGWLLMADHGGPRPTVTAQQWLSVLNQWQDIQDIPVFSYQALIAQYRVDLPQTTALLALVQDMTDTLQRLPDPSACLVHHDVHPGNLVADDPLTGHPWRVIDWEYGGRGCPWLDVAAIQGYWPLSMDDVMTLPLAQGYTPERLQEILADAAHFNDLLTAAWEAVRAQPDIQSDL